MIVYLVSATADAGISEAMRRGWIRLGWFRFATPMKHDVRVVNRISELVPLAGVTLLFRAPDYDEGPPESDPVSRQAWFGREGEDGQRAAFEAFVASGRGRWVSGEEEIPVNVGVVYTPAPAGTAF